MDIAEKRRIGSILSYILYVMGGLFIFSGIAGFLPMHDLKYVVKIFAGEQFFSEIWHDTPLFLYMIKYVSISNLWIGAYFILIGRDPEKYAVFITITIVAFFIAAVILLAAGILYKMSFFWFFGDFIFCVCGGIILLAFRPGRKE